MHVVNIVFSMLILYIPKKLLSDSCQLNKTLLTYIHKISEFKMTLGDYIHLNKF